MDNLKPGSWSPLRFFGEPQPGKSPSQDAQVSAGDSQTTILIVDDDPINRRVARKILAAKPYNLLEAEDGKQAIAMVEEHGPPDLILLDIMMPKMNGYEVCEHIRHTYSIDQLPIILVTAKNQVEDLVAGFRAGANDYLCKPIAKPELMSRINIQLELQRIRRNLDASRLQLLAQNESLEHRDRKRIDQLQEQNLALEAKNREIIQARRTLMRQERLASLGTLTAGIAHEIRNPLHFIANFSETSLDIIKELKRLLDRLRQQSNQWQDSLLILEEIEANAIRIQSHGKRAERIIKRVLDQSSGVPGEKELVDLNSLVDESADLSVKGFRSRHQDQALEIVKDLDPALKPITLVAQDISRVILNLVDNGCYAAHKRTSRQENGYRPRLQVMTRGSADHAEIVIRDNGTGIQREDRERIFDPFYTTKPKGDGTGLGLSICRDIVVQEHGGRLDFDSKPGEFTQFIITLPFDS